MSEENAAPSSNQDTCRATFEGSHDDKKLADKIDASHPNFACEEFSVSAISRSRVQDDETLLRVIISPRDIDEDTGFIHQAPFNKVFQEGLSVVRSTATREELSAIVTDGMYSKPDEDPRAVRGLLTAPVGGAGGVRSLEDENGSRLFGVYDQTVPRRDKEGAPVPTHAGIFLRLPPPGTPSRKNLQKDYAGRLRDLFIATQIDWQESYDGLFRNLNDDAAAGKFVSAQHNDDDPSPA